MLELHVVRLASEKYDLLSLDPESLVAASFLQLLKPGEWQVVPGDAFLSPDGELPYLKDGSERFTSSNILPHLLRSSSSKLSRVDLAQSRALHSLLDTTLLPLVLHSLYSLPTNWTFIRPLVASALPFPSKLYRPEQLRQSSKYIVDATHPDWWGLGGEAEKEEEEERRRRKAMLETGAEGWKERKDEERKEGKQRIKKAFGETKIACEAREVFLTFESALAASSTPYFLSSPEPTPLDAHLSALLSVVLFLPLPNPLLSDLVNASFPRLWSHANLLRRSLWAERPRPTLAPPITSSLSSTFADFVPSSPWDSWSSQGGTVRGSEKNKKKTKKEEEFERKR
ncbi:sorting and assembly machinery component 37, partial [Phenoliferia sp. Uapishka_3]